MPGAFLVGCGYTGLRLARRLLAGGVTVGALARTAGRAEALEAAGLAVTRADLDDPASLASLPVAGRCVHYLAPPPREGTEDPRMRAFLAALDTRAPPARLVLVSTTGVYGDRGGGQVDEDTAPAPGTDRGRRRLDAENAARGWGRAHGVPVVVLRVAGIYGPGRLPLARIARGDPVLAPEECPLTNRVHVDDLVEACIAAALRGRAEAVYNVADGEPGRMTDYFFAVADRYGLPRPPVIPREAAGRELSAGMLSYLGESRRIDNRRLLGELGVTLRYPDLASGLEACAAEDPPAST